MPVEESGPCSGGECCNLTRRAKDRTCLLQVGGDACEVKRLAAALGVPDSVVDRGAEICCSVVGERMFRRQTLPLLAASSTYVACRENRTPVTIKELALAARTRPREIGRCYRTIRDGLQLSVPGLNGTRYAWRVASKVNASGEATSLSCKLVKEAVTNGLGDRNPMTLAAAAVYAACLASGEAVNQSEVAEAAGVSVTSLRSCGRLIRPLLSGPSGSQIQP